MKIIEKYKTMVNLLRAGVAVILLGGGTSSALAAKGGNGKPGGGGGGGDTTPPAAITDLSAADDGESAPFFTLAWTAVGDDGLVGTAANYDARYLVGGTLDETSWETATPFYSVPYGAFPRQIEPAGSAQSAIPHELPYGATCQIGLKAIDDAGNPSALSNVITVTTQTHNWNAANVDDSFDAGGRVRLATASDGTQGIAFGTGEGLFLTEHVPSGAEWGTPELVDSEGSSLQAVVYDPDGNPSILYGGSNLRFARRQNGEWNIQTIDGSSGTRRKSLVYDPEGNPWVSYGFAAGKGRKATEQLKVAGWNPDTQTWDSSVVDPNAENLSSSMVFGPNGPAIVYKSEVQSNDAEIEGHVRYAQWNVSEESWDITNLDAGGLHFGSDVSIALNPTTGRPAVAFGDDSDALHFLQQQSDGNWTTEDIPAVGYAGNLVFHPSGVPYLPLADFVPETVIYFAFAHKTSGFWQLEYVFPLKRLPIWSPQLAITSTGSPSIAVLNTAGRTVIHAERNAPLD